MAEATADKKSAKKAAPKKKAAPRKPRTVRTPFGDVRPPHTPRADAGVPKDNFVEVMNLASRRSSKLRYMDVNVGAGKLIRGLVIEDSVFGTLTYVAADGGALSDELSKLK